MDKQIDAAMFFLAAAIYTAPHMNAGLSSLLGLVSAGFGWYVMHMEKSRG